MDRAAPQLAVDAPEGMAPVDGPPPARPPWRRPPWVWIVAALVVAALALVTVQLVTDDGPPPATRADVDRAVRSGITKAQKDQRNAPPDGTVVYRTVLPSLVAITAEGDGETALGTGFVINDSGAVLTALHVVEHGKRIQVRFADGTQAAATVTTRQPASDIAVLAPARLPEVVVPAVMGGGPRVGDPVFPVGNPLGLVGSLSAGVVSAVDRAVRAPGGKTLQGLIQFDAAVNPGNSGGPLLNRDGQVIGVVTGLANPTQQSYFVGIGFAVPIATAGGAAGGPAQ